LHSALSYKNSHTHVSRDRSAGEPAKRGLTVL